MAFVELSKSVSMEYEQLLLKTNQTEMDTSNQESMCLVQMVSTDKKTVIIQMEGDKTTESLVAPPRTSQKHLPIVVIVISVLQIVLHVFDTMHRSNDKFSMLARILLLSSTDKAEVWRFVTYMFVHQDKFHLGINIFFQLLGGVPLEIEHGWWRIIIVYIVSGIGGSLAVESMSNCSALVGASAGVYGILGAHFSTLILNWKETEDRIIRIFILMVCVLTDLFNWLCIPEIVGSSDFGPTTCVLVSTITNSNITHFFGFVIGTLMAIIVLKNERVRSWERKTQLISFLVLIFLISLAICLIVFMPTFNIQNLYKPIECDKNVTDAIVHDSLVKCEKIV